MFKKNDEIEQKLLTENEIDNLIADKIAIKIEKEITEAKRVKKKEIISDFEKLPKSKTFAQETIYLVFNRKTKRESFINGIQADGLIGLNQEIRNNLINKYADNFTVGEYYVRFSNFAQFV